MRIPDRRSKIVCTLGPAVASYEKIKSLVEAGMDVARLNFSHGTHARHKEMIDWIRKASQELQTPVAILGDLQGPKIRTGKIKGGQALPIKVGQEIQFVGMLPSQVTEEGGSGSIESPISISYVRLAQDLKKLDPVLFDDGLVKMEVTQVQPDKNLVTMKVLHGTALGENKGVNMPEARLSTLGITEKDWDDVLFAVKEDLDYLALSFVRTEKEVRNLKTFLNKKNTGIQIISKIEKKDALENIEEILKASDGLMVARGDLALEIGNEHVPIVQKQLIKISREAGKPVITATQMLMSMVTNPTPSRAEASDVANAVLDGSDALMLSNETASGSYPLEAVQTMANIIKGAEGWNAHSYTRKLESSTGVPTNEAIELAATNLSDLVKAKCLTCLTRSGQAARLLAKYRPTRPIYAFAENKKVQRQLSLTWGVSVIPWIEHQNMDYEVFDDLLDALSEKRFIKAGDAVVMVAGIPTTLQVGTTNTVVVRTYQGSTKKQT